ncbi:MAG: histidine kinase, partial [Bacteroidia bacterium]|nr:histidine kinase [Bacteroidia bacterium]
MKKLFLFSFCAFCYFITSAQQSNIDSLLTLLKKDKEDTAKVTRLNKISEAYWRNSSNDSATASAKAALKLAQQLNFKKGIASAYRNIGWAVGANDYSKGLDYFLKALKISEELGDKKEIANDLRN